MLYVFVEALAYYSRKGSAYLHQKPTRDRSEIAQELPAQAAASHDSVRHAGILRHPVNDLLRSL